MKEEFKPQHLIFNEHYVTCPYCGYKPEESYPEPNGDYEEEECSKCEKKFYTKAEILYSSKMNCTLNGSPCAWEPEDLDWLESNYNHFICPNCKDTKLVKKTPG